MSDSSELKNVGCLFVVIMLVCFGSSLLYRISGTTATFVVKDKERVSTGSGDSLKHKYLVYTDGETFEVVDTWVFFEWNSSDRYGRLDKGAKYTAKVAGWRIPFWSTYRNIIEATPASAEKD